MGPAGDGGSWGGASRGRCCPRGMCHRHGDRDGLSGILSSKSPSGLDSCPVPRAAFWLKTKLVDDGTASSTGDVGSIQPGPEQPTVTLRSAHPPLAHGAPTHCWGVPGVGQCSGIPTP